MCIIQGSVTMALYRLPFWYFSELPSCVKGPSTPQNIAQCCFNHNPCCAFFQHVMKHLNLQPLDPHGVDFSRVRMWNLNNWAKYYRQTLMFSSIQDPQINNIISKHCFNYRGQVSVHLACVASSIHRLYDFN